MKTSSWGWRTARTEGIWRHGPLWMRPFTAAAPWLTLLTLLLLFHVIGGTLTTGRGVLFDLPEAVPIDGEPAELVAVVTPMPHDTTVFFDDARYQLGDSISVKSFSRQLAERLEGTERKCLLLLVDRRVAGGELVSLASIAGRAGARKVLFATRDPEGGRAR